MCVCACAGGCGCACCLCVCVSACMRVCVDMLDMMRSYVQCVAVCYSVLQVRIHVSDPTHFFLFFLWQSDALLFIFSHVTHANGFLNHAHFCQ